MSLNRSQQIDYTMRYQIRSGRVNFADYVVRRQRIQDGELLGLQLFPPDLDASIVPIIQEAAANTTVEEYNSYLQIGGEVPTSSTVTPPPIPTVPDPPTSVSGTAGNTQVVVSFTAPASDGGSAITGYTVTSSPGGFTATGSASPLTVTGLTNGTAYTFTVIATNSIGNSASSSASSAVTPATVPGAPTSVSATAGNAEATVTFSAPASNGGSAITGYTVTSSPGGFTAIGASSPLTVTSLTNGTAYTFTVVATNSIGNSVPSSASSAVTPVGGGDAIVASLTTSLATYNAAANGDWVKITSTEYTALKTNVTGTNRAGISDAYLALMNGSGLTATDQSAIVANTATANTPAIAANNYVYACAISYGKNLQATDLRVFTNTNSGSVTGFNQVGSVLPPTEAGGGGLATNYYVLKGVSSTNGATAGLFAVFSGQTASSARYLGFYNNFSVTNSMRYLLFTPGGSGGIPNSSSTLTGNLPNYGAFGVQALTTATKQWA